MPIGLRVPAFYLIYRKARRQTYAGLDFYSHMKYYRNVTISNIKRN